MTWKRQVAVWVAVLLLLCVVIPYGVAFLIRSIEFFTPTEPLTLAEYDALAAEGAPIVAAIEEYTVRVGLVPLSLGDLPDSAPRAGDWKYHWSPWSFDLSRDVEGGTTLRYSNDDRWPGWGVKAYRVDVPEVTFEQPRPKQADRTEQELRLSIEAEFARRIREFPEDTVHSKGAFSWHCKNRRMDAARTVVLELAESGREPWWCARALAWIDLTTGEDRGAAGALKYMAREDPSFVSWFMVASVFIQTERIEEAAAALGHAAEHPVREQRDVEDGYVLDAFPWQAASWAYGAGRHELVLALCDRWQELEEHQGYTEQSYHALRAAALLALGRTDEARGNLDRAVAAQARQATWAHDLESLNRAIWRNDTDLVWSGDRESHRIDVFITYR